MVGWDEFQEFIDAGPYLEPNNENIRFKFYTYGVKEDIPFQLKTIDTLEEAVRIHEQSFSSFNFNETDFEIDDDDRKAWEILGLAPPQERNKDGSGKSSWSNDHIKEEQDEDLKNALQKVAITDISIDPKTGKIKAKLVNIYPRYSLLGINDLRESTIDIDEKIQLYKATQPDWTNSRTRNPEDYEQEVADKIEKLNISQKSKDWAFAHLHKNFSQVINEIPQTSDLNVYLVPEFKHGYYSYPTFSFSENSRELINKMGIPFFSMNIHMVSDFIFCFKETMSDSEAEQKLKDLGFNYKTPDDKERAVEEVELDAPTILEL